MTWRHYVITIISIILLCVYFPAFSAADSREKGWHQITTGVDSNGVAVTTSVFGYYIGGGSGAALVVCDTSTGEETGRAFIPNAKVGERLVKTLVRYEEKEYEDWTQVKRINPVQVKLMLPNIYGSIDYTDYSWDYYFQTGILRDTAHGPLTWPGPTKGYLVSGSDPDYWLIVAECYNPNSWPVKANINVKLGTWRKTISSSYGSQSINQDNEVTLGANERKYILVSRGRPADCYYLVDDTDWGSYLEAWSEAYFSSRVIENLDPELPAYLKPNNGFISFTNYEGSAPVPNDLSSGYNFYYVVDCREYDGSYSYDWSFDGSVSFTTNGWVASPGPNSKNPDLAKQKVKQFFDSRAIDQLPYVNDHSQTIGDIRFYECKTGNVSVDNGPYKNSYDAGGPALADYTTVDTGADLGEGNGRGQLVSESGTKVPVLMYEPIFVEFYRFTPTDSPKSGKLTKEITPGYLVYNSTVTKPTIKVSDTYQGYTLVHEQYKVGRTWYGNWKVKINHYVNVQAVNTDNDISVSFSNVNIALPNIYEVVNQFENSLENMIQADVSISSPIYNNRDITPSFMNFGTVNIAPGQTKTLFNGYVTTDIAFDEKALSWSYDPWNGWPASDFMDYISEDNIVNAFQYSIPFFNYTGDAAFVGYSSNVSFAPNPAGNGQFLSFIKGEVKYRYKDKYRYDEVGVIGSCSPWLGVLSYFSGDGLGMRTTDNAYVKLLSVKKQSASLQEGDNFWPYMVYDSGPDRWVLNKWRDY